MALWPWRGNSVRERWRSGDDLECQFAAQLIPVEKLIAVADSLGAQHNAFVQFQIDADAPT